MSTRTRNQPVPRARVDLSEPLESRLLMSTTITVDDSGGADFTTIQAAVTAAHAGDTIKVLPGTYNENVNIPADKDDLTLRSDKRWAAVVEGTGGAGLDDSAFKDDGATGVEIRGFKITGPSAGLEYGVLVTSNGSAEIRENRVTAIRSDPLNGVQVGVGIGVLSGSADIRGNVVDDYQKTGIAIDGPTSSADVSQNLVIGVGSTDQIAQNGIQVSSGAKADVSQNVVSNNLFNGTTAGSTGILLSGAGPGTSVSQNIVYHNDFNIAADATTGATIQKNWVYQATYDGITLGSGSTNNLISQNDSDRNGGPGISIFDSSGNVVEKNNSDRNALDGISLFNADNNQIRQNSADDNTFDGIFADADSAGNHISQNGLFGNDAFDAQDQSVGTATAGTANTWDKNKGQTQSKPGLLDNTNNGNGHGNAHGHDDDPGHGHSHSRWNR